MCSVFEFPAASKYQDSPPPSAPQGQPSGFRGHRLTRLLAVAASAPLSTASALKAAAVVTARAVTNSQAPTFATTSLEDHWEKLASTSTAPTSRSSSGDLPPLVLVPKLPGAPRDRRSRSRPASTGRNLAPLTKINLGAIQCPPTAGGVDLEPGPGAPPPQKQRRSRSVSFGPAVVVEVEPPSSVAQDSPAVVVEGEPPSIIAQDTAMLRHFALRLRVRQSSMQLASRFQEQSGEPHFEESKSYRAPPSPDAELVVQLGF